MHLSLHRRVVALEFDGLDDLFCVAPTRASGCRVDGCRVRSQPVEDAADRVELLLGEPAPELLIEGGDRAHEALEGCLAGLRELDLVHPAVRGVTCPGD